MEQSDADWGGHDIKSGGDGVETMLGDFDNDSNFGSLSVKSEEAFNTTGLVEDEEMDYNMYEEYSDSYNESNMTYSDTESKEDFGSGQQVTSEENGGSFINSGRNLYIYPSGREGMATCERCGTVGIKHAFYSKTKRFCSLACSRSFATALREGPQSNRRGGHVPGGRMGPLKTPSKKKTPPKPKPQINTIPSSYNKQNAIKSFDWSNYLNTTCAEAASISYFKHAPMSDSWDNIIVGMKVEVINSDVDLPSTVFWIATVIRIAGYKALIRYEGFGADCSKDFWLNLCTQDVHPVGWCATIGKPLVPPKTIQYKYVDWKEFLVKRLTGARTLPNNFYTKVLESMSSHKFKPGTRLEVVDKMCVSAMRVATVDEIIGGRLRLQYVDSKDENDDFWCHYRSPLIHYVGWSSQAGHKLHSTPEYRSKAAEKARTGEYEEGDASPDMFIEHKDIPNGQRFEAGMKLEAIDPLNLSTICVASVMKVLKNNYLMIGIDGSMAHNGSDWFCYHASSPSIFPMGFCEINSIELTPPRGYKGPFKWFDYLKQTKSRAAPVRLFDKEIPKHGYRVGMKLEAVDLMEPRLICVASVTQIVGRLLRIHFDGWEKEYDQWIDCQSPDIYPVGWCEMVGYHLEGPKTKETYVPLQTVSKKRKTKNQIYKGPRKKRKTRMGLGGRASNGKDVWDLPLQNENLPPPHIPLPAETVAAMLPPVCVEAAEKVKEEASGNMSDSQGSTRSMPQLSPVIKVEPGVQDEPNSGGNEQYTTDMNNTPNSSYYTSNKISSENGTPSGGDSSALPTIPSAMTASQAPEGGATVKTPSSSGGSLPGSPTRPVGAETLSQMLSRPPAQTQPLLSPKPATPHIPRVVPSGDESPKDSIHLTTKQQTILPERWTVFDVCQFLRINDCGAYCDSFSRKNIDGRKFTTLTKEQIVNLTGMKVGPSLKIYDLIQQLKMRILQQTQEPSS
ncbi:MBT domain-containing protein 1 [Lingula anatina]|uniref:MBT domain-containing protein 1 n=1 Tax=Lingula anatina TaxID=7574 RepID=A0A1S3JRX6_LINAN|nr:MBT domain-containing protein 1 [Lingula anatina]|eukprot:XP_013413115.1 MBT domain-containing protein 1 [Lingula anatina]